MTDLSALVERIERATGPDREIDCALALAVDGFFVCGEDPWGRPKYGYHSPSDGGVIEPGQAHDMLVRRYTASLDAALALVERKEAAFYWRLHRLTPAQPMDADGPFWATCGFAGEQEEAHGATPALALLAALLNALIAEQAISQPEGEDR